MRLAGCLLTLAACGPAEAPPAEVMVHRLTRPEPGRPVRLNEDLVFHFSSEVDRTSVTQDSVRVARADGVLARGRLTVEGARVRFVPASVLAPDLADGGFAPGSDYEVVIAGFPRPDGLRSLDGAPLASTYRWSFRTVHVDGRDGPCFEDRDPDRVRPLRLFPAPTGGPELRYPIQPLDAIYLRCEEPLDPASLVDGAFGLRPRAGPEVPLRARLLENEAQAAVRPRPARARTSGAADPWEREPRAALVELLPATRLASGSWRLVFHPEVRTADVAVVRIARGLPPILVVFARTSPGAPRDLGGHPLWEPALVLVNIQVAEGARDEGRGVWFEEFVDTRLRSTIAVPGADGTAAWSESGRVEVRFPKAAGDGRQGDIVLEGAQSSRDISAVRVFIPPQSTCRLSAPPGPVVVRTQGTLRIGGRLERRSTGRSPMKFTNGTLSSWIDGALATPEETAATEKDWTILVAGGDLVVEGEIDVSTPLLLVAGGRIRVSGSVVSAQPGQIFRLGEGGGPGLTASIVEELELDPPDQNPLKTPLRFAVLSGPLPSRGSVAEWLEAEARGSSARRDRDHSRWSVRYVPELARAPEFPEELVPVDSPELLPRPGSIQVLIELIVEPGGRWRPPFVDSVRLAWRESETGDR